MIERKDWKPTLDYVVMAKEIKDYISLAFSRAKVYLPYYRFLSINSSYGKIWVEDTFKHTFICTSSKFPGKLCGIPVNKLVSDVYNSCEVKTYENLTPEFSYRLYSSVPSEEYIIENAVPLNVGVIINKLFSNNSLSKEDLDLVSSAFAQIIKDFSEMDISVLKISEKPSEIYTFKGQHCFNSCMRNQHPEYFKIYDDLKIKILYFKDGDNILGRALIHDNIRIKGRKKTVKMMDRVYYNDSFTLALFTKWAKKNGYYMKSAQSLNCNNYINPETNDISSLTFELDCGNISGKYNRVPYVDTFAFYCEENGVLYSRKQTRKFKTVTDLQLTHGRDINCVVVPYDNYRNFDEYGYRG